eukprot:m51a1_g14837 putative domain containing protein (1290) ;mRNA; r:720960-727154
MSDAAPADDTNAPATPTRGRGRGRGGRGRGRGRGAAAKRSEAPAEATRKITEFFASPAAAQAPPSDAPSEPTTAPAAPPSEAPAERREGDAGAEAEPALEAQAPSEDDDGEAPSAKRPRTGDGGGDDSCAEVAAPATPARRGRGRGRGGATPRRPAGSSKYVRLADRVNPDGTPAQRRRPLDIQNAAKIKSMADKVQQRLWEVWSAGPTLTSPQWAPLPVSSWDPLSADEVADLAREPRLEASVDLCGSGPVAAPAPHGPGLVSPSATVAAASTLVLNAGGPVWAMDWCPRRPPAPPSPQGAAFTQEGSSQARTAVQYLAVSAHRSFMETHRTTERYSGTNCVQVWRVPLPAARPPSSLAPGVSPSSRRPPQRPADEEPLEPPSLALAIVHDGGTAWDLSWAPAGGALPGRLGLLSGVFSDGTVRVYSVPEPPEPSHASYGAFVRLAPAFVATVRSPKSPAAYATAVQWSPRGDMLLAGCNDGYARVWRLGAPTDEQEPVYEALCARWSVRGVAWDPCAPDASVFAVSARSVASEVLFFSLYDPFAPIAKLPLIGVGFPEKIGWTLRDSVVMATDQGPVAYVAAPEYCAGEKVSNNSFIFHKAVVWDVSVNTTTGQVVSASGDGTVKLQASGPRHGHGYYKSVEIMRLSIDDMEARCLKYEHTEKEVAEEEQDVLAPHLMASLHRARWCPDVRAHKWVAAGGKLGLVFVQLVQTKETMSVARCAALCHLGCSSKLSTVCGAPSASPAASSSSSSSSRPAGPQGQQHRVASMANLTLPRLPQCSADAGPRSPRASSAFGTLRPLPQHPQQRPLIALPGGGAAGSRMSTPAKEVSASSQSSSSSGPGSQRSPSGHQSTPAYVTQPFSAESLAASARVSEPLALFDTSSLVLSRSPTSPAAKTPPLKVSAVSVAVAVAVTVDVAQAQQQQQPAGAQLKASEPVVIVASVDASEEDSGPMSSSVRSRTATMSAGTLSPTMSLPLQTPPSSPRGLLAPDQRGESPRDHSEPGELPRDALARASLSVELPAAAEPSASPSPKSAEPQQPQQPQQSSPKPCEPAVAAEGKQKPDESKAAEASAAPATPAAAAGPEGPVAKSQEPRASQTPASKRAQAIVELIETEKGYLDDLTLIMTYYYDPLKKILSEKEMHAVFCDIDMLLPFNSTLLETLAKGESIGRCFLGVADYFKLYSNYCSNESAKLTQCRKLDLRAFLIKPVQRLCKYPLLLREIIRWTDPEDPDFKPLEQAYERVNAVCAAINEKKREYETQLKFMELRDHLSNKARQSRHSATRTS